MNSRQTLLLVGSPRGRHSTSYQLGTFLMNRLREAGQEGETVLIPELAASPEKTNRLLAALPEYSLIILAFPLYVDQLPAPVVRLLEQAAGAAAGRTGRPLPRLLAVVNCGFPESNHNQTALRIVQRFAEMTGFSWAGGLSIGGGGALDGQPLEQTGAMSRRLRRNLTRAAGELAGGGIVSVDTANRICQPLMPRWLYRFAAGLGFRKHRRQLGGSRINAQPY